MDDVLYLRARNPSCCSRIKYERKKSKAKYVPVETAPRIKIPNHDWTPTEEIRLWRQQSFGVNYLNNAFNIAEIERQTKDGEEVRRGWRYIGYCYSPPASESFSNTNIK
jgi:hypothetical protein